MFGPLVKTDKVISPDFPYQSELVQLRDSRRGIAATSLIMAEPCATNNVINFIDHNIITDKHLITKA